MKNGVYAVITKYPKIPFNLVQLQAYLLQITVK